MFSDCVIFFYKTFIMQLQIRQIAVDRTILVDNFHIRA